MSNHEQNSSNPPPIKSAPLPRENRVLRYLVFEDVYIADNGTFEFVDHRGQTIQHPKTSDERFLDPTAEIEFLLPFLRRKASERNEFSLAYDEVRYRVAVLNAQGGVWYVLRRAIREVPHLYSFEGVEILQDLLMETGTRQGLIISTGATGSGKSTFLAALLKAYLNQYGGRAVTIEDPPELKLEGQYPNGRCFQIQIDEHEFQTGLKKALRYRPRYLLIGELRSQAAALTALQAALTGHLVLCTIHGGTVPQALMNLISMAAPHGRTDHAWRQLAEGLQMVASMQRLPDRVAPRAQMLILPGIPNEDGVRNKIRGGNVEQLKDDMESLLARARKIDPKYFNRTINTFSKPR